MNIIENTEADNRHIAAKKLPRSSNKALMDYPPGERETVLNRWSLRQAILDARDNLREAKRIKRESGRKRQKKVDPS